MTDDAVTGAANVIEKAPAATVMLATLVVPRLVTPLRNDTDAALALQAAFTPVKFDCRHLVGLSGRAVGRRVPDRDPVRVARRNDLIGLADPSARQAAERRRRRPHHAGAQHATEHRNQHLLVSHVRQVSLLCVFI